MEQTDTSALIERLAATPGRIAAATAVLAHIRASDDILAPRQVMVLVRDDPALPAFDERRWGEVMAYADPDSDSQELLAGLTFRRAELVRALCRLDPADWQRAGRHEERGPITLEETLFGTD